MKKVIITGANGFVGRHLLKKILQENIEVYAIVRNKINMSELNENYNKIHWVMGDLYENTDKIIDQLVSMGGESADCFYHLAWTGVTSENKNDYEQQMKNITIAMNVLDICKSVQCEKMINLGTVGEYVSLDGLINEKWVPSPADMYGAVKVAVRNIMTVKASLEDISMINTILCSTYGEYRSDDNVISYTIKKLLKGEYPEYGYLNQMWDFLYVDDVALALYLVGEKGVSGKTYSIGSGIYRHLYEYIEIIRDIINPELPLGIGKLGNKYEDVLNSCVDTFQLQKDTGFKPLFSFEEGIRKTVKYFEESMPDEAN